MVGCNVATRFLYSIDTLFPLTPVEPSEGRATELDNGLLARTEILGGNFYPASGDPEQYPTLINRSGRLSAVHAMFWANHTYIIDTWQGHQKTLRLAPGTRFMPLYVTNPSP
jgi:hypothetical protein